MEIGSTLLSLGLGIGLSAACGFRIFVPFTVMSLAARAGFLNLSGSFEWLASTPALIVLCTATVIEIAGYFIPWVDHALDTIATPAALVAGAVATASVLVDVSPMLRWTLAIVAGSGAAGAVQAGTVALRAGSTATTGGLANPAFSAAETTTSLVMSLLAIVLPVLTLFAFMLLGAWVLKRYLRRRADPALRARHEAEMRRAAQEDAIERTSVMPRPRWRERHGH